MRARPAGGVVLVGVLAWISGILQLFAGVLMLVAGDHPLTGWTHLLVGLVTFPVCLGIFRARASARVVVTLVFAVEIAAVVFSLIDLRLLATPAITSAVLAVFGLALLYTPSANASFRRATLERRRAKAAEAAL
ncbi:hypothetical protein G5T42_09080 [Microbacterium sp. 4R-513]|uniref:hypothetical protein n=1 Tax=Microbacterium sp. 4R-513 TaxID=2567934 RepID=UPI0013E1E6DF|nr:hypothetical protein [Microbacterium sp. 4R-513]QIG39620.1 hypothetical protein G5T42_09080 [Microbacterium sp. 4R-513]